jgi:hypothetical protein
LKNLSLRLSNGHSFSTRGVIGEYQRGVSWLHPRRQPDPNATGRLVVTLIAVQPPTLAKTSARLEKKRELVAAYIQKYSLVVESRHSAPKLVAHGGQARLNEYYSARQRINLMDA